jgi:hypothetical protein
LQLSNHGPDLFGSGSKSRERITVTEMPRQKDKLVETLKRRRGSPDPLEYGLG